MGRNRRVWRGLKGFGAAQDLTEYSLILGLIGIVVFTAYLAIGNNIHNVANNVDTFLSVGLSAF